MKCPHDYELVDKTIFKSPYQLALEDARVQELDGGSNMLN